MKKLLLKSILLLCALIVATSAWADQSTAGFTLASTTTVPLAANADPQTTTITGSASETWNVEITGTWTSSSMQGSSGSKCWQMGKKDAPITSAIFSTSGLSGTISSVVVRCYSYNAVAKVNCTVGGSNFGTQNQSSGNSLGNVTFSGSAAGKIVVTIDNSGSGARAAYIQSITVTYNPPAETKVSTPTFTLSEGLYYGTKSVEINTTTTGDNIYYTTDGTEPTSSSTLYEGAISVSSTQTIKAIGIKAGLENSDIASAEYTIITEVPACTPKAYNTNYFVKVTDASELEDGDAVLIVNQEGDKAMADHNASHYRNVATASSSNGVITALPNKAQKFVLIKAGNRFFFSTGDNSYIYASSPSNNYLDTSNESTAGANALASVAIDASGNATIIFLGDNSRNNLRYNYNSGSPRFACYASSSSLPVVQIYKEMRISGPSNPVVDGSTVTLTTTANMAGWRTFAPIKADQNYTVDGTTKVYYASATADSKVTLTEIADGVPANTPVILHQTSGTTITLTETATSISAPGSNLLQVSTASQNLGTVYRLGYKSTYGVGFYTYTTNSAPAGIVYLSTVNAAHEFLGFDFDGETTAINNLTPSLSKGEGEYYDLQGRKVDQPTKGLYIVNGKKVIVK